MISPAISSDLGRESDVSEKKRDAILVNRFKRGDIEAFNELYSLHHERVTNLVMFFLKNRTDAEEITQDAFVRVHRSIHNFRGDSSFATWLYRIASNLAKNKFWFWERRKRYQHASLDWENDLGSTFSDMVAAQEPDAESEASIAELAELIDICMDALDPRQKEILRARNVLGLSYGEISEVFCIKAGTVKSRIARARGSLIKKILAKCPEFGDERKLIQIFRTRLPQGMMDIGCLNPRSKNV